MMNKGTPEQLRDAIAERIAELRSGTVESATDIKAGWAGSSDNIYRIEDESLGVEGDFLTYDELYDLFNSSKGDPVIDGYYGDFDSWLYDTVNSGYLKMMPARDDIGCATNTCNMPATPIMGDDYDIDDYSEWYELASKSVTDSDGFLTDYTLYEYQGRRDDVEYPYLCMFGDKDLYEPDEGYADWSGETEEEAWDWFNNYGEEDGYTTDAIDSSECIECDYDEGAPYVANISEEEIDRLYEIAEMYNTSDPVSGDWDTETEHEMNTIAKEFEISLDDAKELMIEYLGFEDDMF